MSADEREIGIGVYFLNEPAAETAYRDWIAE